MGPQLSPPSGPGERPPESLPQLKPVGSEIVSVNPYENTAERSALVESKEQVTGAGAGDQSPADLALPAKPLAIPQIDPVAVPAPTVAGASPLVADDVDLIEKEWVTKSKEIQKKFRDDPHGQRTQVSELNADYLSKRFGVQVKLPQE